MDIVWQATPEQAARTVTGRFLAQHGIDSYDALVARSIGDPTWFWSTAASDLGIAFDPPYTEVVDGSGGIERSTWFVDGGINLAATVLRWAASRPDEPAVVVDHEDGTSRALTWSGLAREVRAAAGALVAGGTGPGDRVALLVPYGIEAVVSFLAVAWAGAIAVPIFSGFGAEAIAQRLVASDARTLVTATHTERKGRRYDLVGVARDAVALAVGAGAPGPRHVLVVGPDDGELPPMGRARVESWDHAVAAATPLYEAAPTTAEDVVLIAYTSGTTGAPKGAVHVHGGLTVKVAQEAAFQTDLQPGDVLCWVTDLGWIMGPWAIIGALANGASLVCVDGSPDHPAPTRLWSVVERHGVTCLGVSPTLIRALASADALPDPGQLDGLRSFASTGEPWNPAPWWWLFEEVGDRRVPIVNLSGGTEIGACLLSVNLLQGIKPTSLGGPSLGIAVEVHDDEDRAVVDEVGELVVRRSWPAMTRGLWQDPERYLATYWQARPGTWTHGDWASVDDDGFWFLHGRSDDTLNVAGKRIGPAEIESVAVADPDVLSAAAVGLPDEIKGESVALFCVVRPDRDPDVVAGRVTDAVVAALGPPFRPKHVCVVPDLPRTRSAKIVRRAVRAAAIGLDPGDLSTLENPESLGSVPLLAPPPSPDSSGL